MDTYRIANWANLYENNRTRELKRLDWVPVPNRMDGDGYTELLDHKNGAAHLGAWLAIVQIASRCDPRGTLLREGGRPHDTQTLARISRIPESIFRDVLPRLLGIGWLEQLNHKGNNGLGVVPQKGAGIPQDDAVKPQDVALNGREWKGMEGNGKPPCAADAPQAGELPLVEVGLPLQSKTAKPSDGWLEAEHDRWYRDAYWCHQDKAASRRAFKKRVLALISEVHQSAEGAVAFLHQKAQEDRARFETTQAWEWRQNLYPATWLNGQRWEDRPRECESTSSSPARLDPVAMAKKRRAEMLRDGTI